MIDFLIALNGEVVRRTGEPHGILQPDILEAIVGRLYNSYYPEHPAYDAAIVIQGVAHGHPFEQGNKRTAVTFLKHTISFEATEDELFDFIQEVARGMEIEKIADWIMSHLK